ncbi:MAG TPA: CTP synthase [Candidatus Paceibacterota bacterium]
MKHKHGRKTDKKKNRKIEDKPEKKSAEEVTKIKKGIVAIKIEKNTRGSIAKPKRKQKFNHKYIFVVGGVMSGVGKGIATSSIGTLLQAEGFEVNLAKVDPYLNVDAGTMNPTEHGEVFVLNSGLETDQDMGNYERFLNRDVLSEDYMTSGTVYKAVIDRERNLGYGGKCVEAVPHIRDEIVRRYEHTAKINKSEISIIEIGGTVGDYQNIMFIEAARLLKIRHPNDVLFVMVSYLPIPSKIGEMKSRPTQNAIHQLASYGVYTDIIIARSEKPVDKKRKEKIAIACNVLMDNVISAPDIDSIYDVPGNFDNDKLGKIIMKFFKLEPRKGNGLGEWRRFAKGVKNFDEEAHIAIIGKYFNTGDFVLTDAYLSVLEAIKYSCYTNKVKPKIHAINASDFEIGNPDYSVLEKYDGIIVPGGFGETGIEGKLNVIRYARENKIPFFGLCYGMQLMTIEFARNVLGLAEAHTAEINSKSPHLVIDIMPGQKKKLAEGNYGGSMRLGLYPAKLLKNSVAHTAYGSYTIKERHRHRYEVNPKYIDRLEKGGLVFSGKSPDGILMEIAELSSHPFFLGTQFHPEFLARPLRPHPLFNEFIKTTKEQRRIKMKKQNKEIKENKRENIKEESVEIRIGEMKNEIRQ